MKDSAGPQPAKTAPVGARTRRYVLSTIVLLCLALILTQVFLHQTSVGSPKFVRGSFLLWTATIVVILALLILATVLGRNLIKLYFERKSGLVGSRFKAKMVTTFVVLSLLPAALLFLLSFEMLNLSIEQWFSAPAAQMLENSKAVSLQYYQDTQRRANRDARAVADALIPEEVLDPSRRGQVVRLIAGFSSRFGIEAIRLYDRRAAPLAETGEWNSGENHQPTILRLVESSLRGSPDYQVDRLVPRDPLKELVWATAPVRNSEGRVMAAVLIESLIPSSVHFKAYSVLEAYDKYQQLERDKTALRFNVLLMLALSSLLIVFAFSWFAMYLAKRITVPIQALAEGAEAVAAGNLDYRVDCEAFDELENLVASFNRMTADLQENETRIESAQDRLRQKNEELEDRRRYIETILQTIATGVISLDSDCRVRTLNRAAVQILQVTDAAGARSLEDLVQGPSYEILRSLLNRASVLGWASREVELNLAGRTLNLAATVTPLLDSSGKRTGWVLVLDDVTELLRMERMAAWQEVARRMAHEIKNPLTPIQLSAERIVRRYRNILEAAGNGAARESLGEFEGFVDLLEDSSQTIIREAQSLKNLVDEFTRFARMPTVRPVDTDIHQVLESTLSLYNGRVQDVRLLKRFGPDIPVLPLDPEQIRRVFINLFDNALEAMAGSRHTKILQINTFRNTLQQSVRVEVSDTGCGFPKEYQDSLFLPYFSTRKGGTGLGLAIVRQIVSDHHGYVRAEPNIPLGTKIIIDLPLARTV